MRDGRAPGTMPKVPAAEWLNSELDRLIGMAAGATPGPNPFDARSWTWLKLAVLDAYIPLYLRILRPRYQRLVFVDLFGGSGVSLYREGALTVPVPGSSIVAASYRTPTDPESDLGYFDHIVAIEKDPDRADSLRSALDARGYHDGQNCSVILGDANSRVPEIRQILKPRETHALLFADPAGLDLHLQTLRDILRSHSGTDIFVTHLTSGAGRQLTPDAEHSKMTAVYGSEEWRKCGSRKDLTALYERALKGLRDIVFPIPVQDGFSGYYYDLFFGVRKTSKGSGWAGAVRSIKSKVNSLTGKEVERLIRTKVASPSGSGGKVRQRQLIGPPDRPASSGSP